MQKATAVREVTARSYGFILARKRIDVFYKANSGTQETYVYCAHRSFKELVA